MTLMTDERHSVCMLCVTVSTGTVVHRPPGSPVLVRVVADEGAVLGVLAGVLLGVGETDFVVLGPVTVVDHVTQAVEERGGVVHRLTLSAIIDKLF